MHLNWTRYLRRNTGLIVSVIIFIALIIGSWAVFNTTQDKSGEEQAKLLRDALRRAAVSCYAIEGRYPPTIDYIVDNYGVVVNDEKFIIAYNAFGENIMPTIRVLEIGKELNDD